MPPPRAFSSPYIPIFWIPVLKGLGIAVQAVARAPVGQINKNFLPAYHDASQGLAPPRAHQ